jgi:hypothetical protein
MLCPRLTKRGASPGLREMGLGNRHNSRRTHPGSDHDMEATAANVTVQAE